MQFRLSSQSLLFVQLGQPTYCGMCEQMLENGADALHTSVVQPIPSLHCS